MRHLYAENIDSTLQGVALTTVGADQNSSAKINAINEVRSQTGTATNTLASNTVTRLDVNSATSANVSMLAVDKVLEGVINLRSSLGAVQNRLDSIISSLHSTSENLRASRSRIQGADFAAETANLTRAQILQQAGTSILSQANSLPQTALSLLQ